ncbi:MAG: DUF2188 domain-containing protein [Firmicutes bacterium]|nr:DUF2188 domain-containing protein [Bacillota bacterium]
MKALHVTPLGKGNWQIKHSNATQAIATFKTQQEAIPEARKIAKLEKLELFIHGKDGKIRQKDSYGNDPRNIKG